MNKLTGSELHGPAGSKAGSFSTRMPNSFEDLPYRPCVGIMLANKEGKIFAGQRFDSELDAWQMPQGGIDDAEEPLCAAKRELEEETGIRPEFVELVASIPSWLHYDLPPELVPSLWNGRFRGQKQKWYLFRFVGPDSEIDIATKNPEFSKWKWFPPDVLVGSIVPFKREVYHRVIKEFSRLI